MILAAFIGGEGLWVTVAPGARKEPDPCPGHPDFQRADLADGGVEVRLGHPIIDLYLEFLAARCRPNMVFAAGFDRKVLFTLFPVEPTR